MSTDKPQVPKGFKPAVKPSDNGDDVPVINGDEPLEPGTELRGTVLQLRDGESGNGPWFIMRLKDEERGVLDYFCKDEAKRAVAAGDVSVGDELYIFKDTEEKTFKNRDGDSITYNPTKCYAE